MPTTIRANSPSTAMASSSCQLDPDHLWLWDGTKAITLPSAPRLPGDSAFLSSGGVNRPGIGFSAATETRYTSSRAVARVEAMGAALSRDSSADAQDGPDPASQHPDLLAHGSALPPPDGAGRRDGAMPDPDFGYPTESFATASSSHIGSKTATSRDMTTPTRLVIGPATTRPRADGPSPIWTPYGVSNRSWTSMPTARHG
jgi:hypothetical protein